jgi:hypothetical protein
METAIVKADAEPLRGRNIFAVFLSIMLMGSGCGSGEPTGAPPHPPGVPKAAMWIGGADGGAFVLVEKTQADPLEIYRGKIYYEKTGELWYQGKLRLEPSGKAVPVLAAPQTFVGWDGEALHLTDGRSLRAIDPR